MEMITKNGHRISSKGDKVIKEFYSPHGHLTDEWLDTYSLYEKTYNNVVKVHECSPEHIVMDYVDGKSINWDRYYFAKKYIHSNYVKFHETLKQICEIEVQFYNFAASYGKAFYHTDCGEGNLLLTDEKVMIIDPDSFRFDDFVDCKKLEKLYITKEWYCTESSKCANHMLEISKAKGILWK